MLESITKSKFLFGYHTWIQCYIHPKKERILFMRSKPKVSMASMIYNGQELSKPISKGKKLKSISYKFRKTIK